MHRYLNPGQPLSPEIQRRVLDQFYRDGFAVIPGVLQRDEVELIRRVTDGVLDDPGLNKAKHNPEGFILRNSLQVHPLFVELMMREPVLGLAEAVVGTNCKFVGQNVIRNPPGTAIARWHVDDTVEFPLPPEIPRHDPRMRMPVQWLTIQMALSDITGEEDGPTQFVPGSHYSGRGPNDQANPTFEGRGPVSILCQAGDIYLQNNQTWHRGAPNTGSRTRYLTQTQYAQRWAFTRFNEYNRVPVPEEFLREADPRARDLLGVGVPTGIAYARA
jgi:ectoine hydroxylase-related dioxygenase (phytanoyl-CoA dioxygenase family)